jgi:hypothetical protein
LSEDQDGTLSDSFFDKGGSVRLSARQERRYLDQWNIADRTTRRGKQLLMLCAKSFPNGIGRFANSVPFD